MIDMYSKDTKIGDIVEKDPEKVDILLSIGMHCIGCMAAQDETIEQACYVHGIDPDEVVEELNKQS